MGQSPVPLATTSTITPTVTNNKQPSDSENTDEDIIGKGELNDQAINMTSQGGKMTKLPILIAA